MFDCVMFVKVCDFAEIKSVQKKNRCRPIIANVVDCGDHVRNGAKLHFAEKQIKLTENKENEKPVLPAQTTARRKGNLTWKRLSLLARNLETREC